MTDGAAGAAPASRLRRALVLSTGGTGGARIVGAIGGLLAARLLGPSGRGELALLVLFATVLSMACAAGVQFWIARDVAQSGGVRSAGWIVRTHVRTVLLVVAVVAILGAVVTRAWGGTSPADAVAACAFGATAAVALVVLALPNGMRAMGVIAGATVVAAVIYAGVTAVLLALDAASPGLVLAGGVLGNLVAIGIAAAWARRAPRGARPVTRGAAEYRRAVRFGLPAGLGELVLLAMLRVDVLIVALFLPLRAVGLYAVATALTEVLWIVPDGVAQVVLPTTARNPDHSRTGTLLVVTVAVTAAAGVVMVALARWVFEVGFGARFVGADAAVPWLVVAACACGVWKIIGSEVVARGHTTPRLTSALVGLVVMVAVDLVAIPAMGIAGAGLGSAAGYAAAAVVVATAWGRLGRTSRLVVTDPPECSGARVGRTAVEVTA